MAFECRHCDIIDRPVKISLPVGGSKQSHRDQSRSICDKSKDAMHRPDHKPKLILSVAMRLNLRVNF